MKNGRGLIRTVALLICLVMIGTLLPLAASAALPTPKLNSAKADGEGIRVSWQAVTGADSYRVYRKDANSGWKAIANVTGTSYKDGTAKEKVTYTYTVRCVVSGSNASDFDHTGVSAAWSKATAGYTATPKLVSATATSKGIKVTWQKVSGATGYRIFRKDDKNGWTGKASVGDTTTWEDTNCVSGTKYTYTVRSLKGTTLSSDFDAKGVSATWNSGIAPGDVAAPKLSTVVSEGSGLRVTWQAVSDSKVKAYRVFRKDGTKNYAKLVDVSGTSYLDNATNAGTVYTYTVRCLDKDGKLISSFDNKGISGSWTAPTPGNLATPVLGSATNGTAGITVTWNAVTGADGYRVYRDAGSGWKAIADVTGTSYVDKNVTSGTSYKYTVRAMKSGKVASSFDAKGLTRIFYAVPKLKSATSEGDGIKVTWEAVKGAPMYRVYRKTNGIGSYAEATTTTSTSFYDKKVTLGNTYTYTVRVISADGKKTSLSAYDATGISCTYVGKSAITSLTNRLTGVEIKWGSVSGVTKYEVQRKTGEGVWTTLTTTTSTSYTDTKAVNNTTHAYRVRALDSANKVIGSYDTNGVSITYYVAPTLVSCVRSGSGLKTTWEAVEGVSNYVIYRRYDTGSWKRVGTSTTTTFQDDTPPSGTLCYYTVRCANASGTAISHWREPGVGMTSYMDQPVLKAAVNANGTITVSWNSVDKATNYRVYRKTGAKTSWDVVKNDTTALSWTDSNVVAGTTYTYSVSVTDGTNELSLFNSTGVTATYYAPTTLKTIENGKTGVDLTWAPTDYMSTYNIYRKTGNDTDWVLVGTKTGTTFTDTNVKSNGHYTYTIRGTVGGAVATANSNTLATDFYAPPKLTKIQCLSTGIKITWDAEPGIEKYRVYRSDNGSSWVAIKDVSATEYTDTTATTVGTKYKYTVRCLKGSTRVSQYNSTKSATFIKAPTGIGGSSPKAGQAKITWNATYGVKSYTVKRRTATTSFVTVKTGITTGSYVDSVPSPGNYIYIVVAVAEDGTNSAYSAEKVISVN